MSFTKEAIERAKQTDIVNLLRKNREEVIKSGGEWRWKRHPSVTIRGNKWYKHSEGVGGNAIEFVKKFGKMNYIQAINLLTGTGNIKYIPPREKKVEQKAFVLPKSNYNMNRAYAYLTETRQIDGDIITYFVKKQKIYEEKKYHNVVFVGYDELGVPRSASKRGIVDRKKKFRMVVKDSNLKYNFSHKGKSDSLYVFESPIDMLSFICLNKSEWEKHNYISLGGVGEKSMLFFLQKNSQIKNIYLCLDNDKAGKEARVRMIEKLKNKKYDIVSMFPKLKDWNEDLIKLKKELRKKNEKRQEQETGGMI